MTVVNALRSEILPDCGSNNAAIGDKHRALEKQLQKSTRKNAYFSPVADLNPCYKEIMISGKASADIFDAYWRIPIECSV